MVKSPPMELPRRSGNAQVLVWFGVSDNVLGMRLLGKHVVVTGAASGLGAAIAAACAKEGAQVTGIDRMPGTGGADIRIADVGDEAAVKQALSGLSRIDALVNSAGVARRAKLDRTAMEDFDAVLRVNLRGTFLASKYAVPLMRPQGGSILHLASGVGLMGIRNRSAYSASKGAVIALTRNMALDYAAERIRVNCLCPGFVKTPLLDGLLKDEARTAQLVAQHPLGRLGEPADIAHAAVFLLSDEAAWITGQAIAVDGGLTAGNMANI
jgi:NAD(P)-dependent dehydrogenase (short-subunit alcohol dehydrogenase family)